MLGPVLRGTRGHRAAATLVIIQLGIGIAITVFAVLIGDYFVRHNGPSIDSNTPADLAFIELHVPGDRDTTKHHHEASLARLHGVAIENLPLHALERDTDRIDDTHDVNFLDAGSNITAIAGFTLRAGRDFVDADNRTGAAIVTESLHLPVGARFTSRSRGPSVVVGVIANAPGYLLGDAGVIYAHTDLTSPHQLVLVRGPGLSVADHVRSRTAPVRSVLGVLVVMVATIIVVIVIGSTGLTYFLVTRRTREIGMRRALGAKRRDIVGYFVLENLALTTAAIIVGLAIVALVVPARFYEQEGFEVRWPLIALAVTATALLNSIATWIPARKAATVPPVVASRAS